MRPTAYYTEESGLGLALTEQRRLKERVGLPPALCVGMLGLGVGTTAALRRAGDTLQRVQREAFAEAPRKRWTDERNSLLPFLRALGVDRLRRFVEPSTQENITQHRWWPLPEIFSSAHVTFAPRQRGTLLQHLLVLGPPASPLLMGD
jgi:hypothetical protein